MLIKRINSESGVISNTPIKDKVMPFCLLVNFINIDDDYFSSFNVFKFSLIEIYTPLDIIINNPSQIQKSGKSPKK